MHDLEDSERFIEYKREELINGVIYMMAPASMEHSRISGTLTTRMTTYVESKMKGPDDPDAWVIIPEAWTYYDQHNSFVHDLAAYIQKDLSKTSESGAIKARPVWVCEILSPSNWINDTQHKRVVLEKYKVPFYWLVDPMRKSIQVFELKDGNEHYQLNQTVIETDRLVSLAPFDGLNFDLTQVFKV